MTDLPVAPHVLLVADPDRLGELVVPLGEPLPQGPFTVLVSTGGDDTIDLFAARRPHVVVVTATLETGDSKALVETLRGMVPRAEVSIVLIGDPTGPIRTALDAAELAPDKFVTSPVAANALRFAVGAGLEAVTLVRDSRPAGAPDELPGEPTAGHRDQQRARWDALADSFVDEADDLKEYEPADSTGEEAAALPPIAISPRRNVDGEPAPAWQPGNTAALPDPDAGAGWADPAPPTREPTLIIQDPVPAPTATDTAAAEPEPGPPERPSAVNWAGTRPLAALAELGELAAPAAGADREPHDTIGASTDDDDDELLDHVDDPRLDDEVSRRRRDGVRDAIDALDDLPDSEPPTRPSIDALTAAHDGRDFARQLRAKMSKMAQRLFQGGDAETPAPAVDLKPRHDHHTEFDLASLGEEPALDRGVTEIEARVRSNEVQHTTSPGSWDTQIRERGLPDSGELIRGQSDASMLLAKMFAQESTGRITFRRDRVEKVVMFDLGRPVFAASSEPRDRMGVLLVREGKITASQYERCQTVGAESGRRMGEILVDFGYLKRRELLPAVRRHVEDILYSLFGWDRGSYQIEIDATPSAERIRLSRHPAALILEGVRRKLDRTTLDRLIGSASTVIEVPDRERLGGVINLGELAPEERGALAAFDGQADLATIARTAGVDVADVLPLAWGLCVLGLATARRTDTEVPDEGAALVGETDLAIDRERVRARWRLVDEADYFALLGVRRDATAFEIRRAYQGARRDFAVDGFPTDLRRELAQELDDIAHVLDEAFRVLRDDRLRRTYLVNLID